MFKLYSKSFIISCLAEILVVIGSILFIKLFDIDLLSNNTADKNIKLLFWTIVLIFAALIVIFAISTSYFVTKMINCYKYVLRDIIRRRKVIKLAIKRAVANKYYKIAARIESKVVIINTEIKKLTAQVNWFKDPITKVADKNSELLDELLRLRNQYNIDTDLQNKLADCISQYGDNDIKTIEVKQDIWEYNHYTNIVNYLSLFPEKLDEVRPDIQ